jgi:hypothetical protein
VRDKERQDDKDIKWDNYIGTMGFEKGRSLDGVFWKSFER